jgi:hypothetical protein
MWAPNKTCHGCSHRHVLSHIVCGPVQYCRADDLTMSTRLHRPGHKPASAGKDLNDMEALTGQMTRVKITARASNFEDNYAFMHGWMLGHFCRHAHEFLQIGLPEYVDNPYVSSADMAEGSTVQGDGYWVGQTKGTPTMQSFVVRDSVRYNDKNNPVDANGKEMHRGSDGMWYIAGTDVETQIRAWNSNKIPETSVDDVHRLFENIEFTKVHGTTSRPGKDASKGEYGPSIQFCDSLTFTGLESITIYCAVASSWFGFFVMNFGLFEEITKLVSVSGRPILLHKKLTGLIKQNMKTGDTLMNRLYGNDTEVTAWHVFMYVACSFSDTIPEHSAHSKITAAAVAVAEHLYSIREDFKHIEKGQHIDLFNNMDESASNFMVSFNDLQNTVLNELRFKTDNSLPLSIKSIEDESLLWYGMDHMTRKMTHTLDDAGSDRRKQMLLTAVLKCIKHMRYHWFLRGFSREEKATQATAGKEVQVASKRGTNMTWTHYGHDAPIAVISLYLHMSEQWMLGSIYWKNVFVAGLSQGSHKVGRQPEKHQSLLRWIPVCDVDYLLGVRSTADKETQKITTTRVNEYQDADTWRMIASRFTYMCVASASKLGAETVFNAKHVHTVVSITRRYVRYAEAFINTGGVVPIRERDGYVGDILKKIKELNNQSKQMWVQQIAPFVFASFGNPTLLFNRFVKGASLDNGVNEHFSRMRTHIETDTWDKDHAAVKCWIHRSIQMCPQCIYDTSLRRLSLHGNDTFDAVMNSCKALDKYVAWSKWSTTNILRFKQTYHDPRNVEAEQKYDDEMQRLRQQIREKEADIQTLNNVDETLTKNQQKQRSENIRLLYAQIDALKLQLETAHKNKAFATANRTNVIEMGHNIALTDDTFASGYPIWRTNDLTAISLPVPTGTALDAKKLVMNDRYHTDIHEMNAHIEEVSKLAVSQVVQTGLYKFLSWVFPLAAVFQEMKQISTIHSHSNHMFCTSRFTNIVEQLLRTTSPRIFGNIEASTCIAFRIESSSMRVDEGLERLAARSGIPATFNYYDDYGKNINPEHKPAHLSGFETDMVRWSFLPYNTELYKSTYLLRPDALPKGPAPPAAPAQSPAPDGAGAADGVGYTFLGKRSPET